MCEDHYLPNEFNYIIYQASSGGISCPDSDARISYYGISGFPTLKFDGNWDTQVGAPSGDVNGLAYMAKVDARRAESTSPLAVYIKDYDLEGGSPFCEVGVKLFADFDPTNHKVRVAIVEDNLSYGGTVYQNICRDVLPDQTLTISTAGEEQLFTIPITVGGDWNTNNIALIAFVQNDTNKFVENSGNSLVGEYAAVAGVDGPQQVIADGGQVTFADASIINVGLNTDTFDVSIDTSFLPDGWDASLLYDGATGPDFSVALDPYGSASFNVVMDTGTVGTGRVIVNVFSQGAGEVIQTLEFVALAGGTDFLIVADDGGVGAGFNTYGPAIEAAGKTYAVWNLDFAPITGDDLLAYDAIIWETGANSDCMSQADRDALDAYLAADKPLILAGEDLLESLYTQGGSARLWYQLKLRFNYGSSNSNELHITGVDGDPIGDGVDFTLTGGDPDMPSLLSGQPVEVACEYDGVNPAVLRTTYSDYQVVYFAFGLERVPDQATANDLMYDSLMWLGVLGTTDAETPVAKAFLSQNSPNPFNPLTKISFNLDHAGQAKLEIFNARGQLVRVLADEALASGAHEYTWQGRTDSGQQAASGTYFYRLTTSDETMTRKMSLVK